MHCASPPIRDNDRLTGENIRYYYYDVSFFFLRGFFPFHRGQQVLVSPPCLPLGFVNPMLLSIREREKGEGRSGTEPNSLGDAQRTRLDAVTFVLFSSTVRLASPPQFASRLAEQLKENGLTRGDVEKNASGQQSCQVQLPSRSDHILTVNTGSPRPRLFVVAVVWSTTTTTE